jgi:glycerol-3-phosphate dehydrogenase
MAKILVIGGGRWATSTAPDLERLGHEVTAIGESEAIEEAMLEAARLILLMDNGTLSRAVLLRRVDQNYRRKTVLLTLYIMGRGDAAEIERTFLAVRVANALPNADAQMVHELLERTERR